MKADISKILTDLSSVVIFRNACRDSVMENFKNFLYTVDTNKSEYEKVNAYGEFVEELYKCGGDFGKHICKLLECDDNMYVKAVSLGENVSKTMTECFYTELKFFSGLTGVSPLALLVSAGINSGNMARYDNTLFDFSDTIPQRLDNASKYGYGMYAKYGMFRLDENKHISPVLSPDTISIDELIGYEYERGKVVDNTKALLCGKPAANVLLCGDAGTGKSSTVKAVANMFKDDGIRLIEMKKDELSLLPYVMGEISKNPLKFIIFIDDLSFASDDDGFGALKASLEGSASAKARNAVIYATSNRRHLVKETFSQREGDDVHRRDTMEELMSLSERFGLTILFSKPDKALYLKIVKTLVSARNIEIDEKELELKAEAFALSKGGRTARVAEQFANSLLI